MIKDSNFNKLLRKEINNDLVVLLNNNEEFFDVKLISIVSDLVVLQSNKHKIQFYVRLESIVHFRMYDPEGYDNNDQLN